MNTRDLTSPVMLTQIFQTSFGSINRVIAELNLAPELCLNGIAYYTAADVDRIRQALNEKATRSSKRQRVLDIGGMNVQM